MHIEDILKKAAAFVGYTEAGFDGLVGTVFYVNPEGAEGAEEWKPWNPLKITADNDELIANLRKSHDLFISAQNMHRIQVYGQHILADGSVGAMITIVELAKNHNQNIHAARRMAITKLAATLYDLRGVS